MDYMSSKGMHRRSDRLLKEKRHDVYRETGKWPEATLCTKCGALFNNGRWSWGESPVNANQTICPACRRVSDNLPAGYIELKGTFFQEHSDEILNLIRNIEQQEKGQHPLERIMTITDQDDCTLVTTTGIHLARRIGEALSRSYNGEFSFHYAEDERSIRVYWQRT
jgi:NMD protein affecting ribosome stability and mRNA decay